MRKYGKFAALIVIVIGTLVWLATAGMNETKTYYKTISELSQMKDEAYGKRLRVGGDVAAGSIQRVGSEVRFTLTQDTNTNLKVAYTGRTPFPTRSRMARKRWPTESSIRTACSGPPRFRPNALRSTKSNPG